MRTKKSWLSNAKRVEDIGGYSYWPIGGMEWDEKREERSEAKRQILVSKPLPVSDAIKPYFGCRLHDSSVLGLERTNKAARISLFNVNASDFARNLCQHLELDEIEIVWKTDLCFEQPYCLRMAWPEPHRGLIFSRPEVAVGADLISDWFFTEDSRVQWIAELWKSGNHSQSTTLYLMIDCERVDVVDHCITLFERHFGKGGRQLYLDALSAAAGEDCMFNVYDGRDASIDFIKRRILVRGLVADDFRPVERS